MRDGAALGRIAEVVPVVVVGRARRARARGLGVRGVVEGRPMRPTGQRAELAGALVALGRGRRCQSVALARRAVAARAVAQRRGACGDDRGTGFFGYDPGMLYCEVE